MRRQYQSVLAEQFASHRQMAMISGPRQVGKTTLARSFADHAELHYFNWDDLDDRALLLEGGRAIAARIGLDRLRARPPIVVFDELHKHSGWKSLLKGFYDRYGDATRILVTGSARMDIYKKGGDSLMGRYFHYRLHPFSVREALDARAEEEPATEELLSEIRAPERLDEEDFEALLRWGGFPEPWQKRNTRFFNRWARLRDQQLFREDLRELTQVQALGQMEMLALLLRGQVGQLTRYSALANKVRVSVDTVRRWLGVLESLYYCFSVRPWSRNVTRSLIKEPKFYLWDWSRCDDAGARCENFIASHLLKAVHFWTDTGLGDYGLYFLRDKEKREVDFLITKNGEPWFLVEAKSSANQPLSKHLEVFARQLGVRHAFQVALDGEYEGVDAFSAKRPVIVSARSFLSQLV